VWLRRCRQSGKLERCLWYVDDALICSYNPEKVIEELSRLTKFKIAELPPTHYLGGKWSIEGGKIMISAETYIKEFLAKIQGEHDNGMARGLRKENNPVDGTGYYGIRVERDGLPRKRHRTPMEPDTYTTTVEDELLNSNGKQYYQRIIGCLQWVVTLGRLDIVFPVTSLARHTMSPRRGHLEKALRVAGYLRTYPKLKIAIDSSAPEGIPEFNEKVRAFIKERYPEAHEELSDFDPSPGPAGELPTVTFTDSDWAGEQSDMISVMGVMIMVGRTPVIVKCKKQSGVQCSSWGAELTAARLAVELTLGLRQTMRSMGIGVKGPTMILGDNLGVIQSCTNPDVALKRKHHLISWHYCRWAIASGAVSFAKVKSEFNFADVLTKSVSTGTFKELVGGLMYG
jgi:hypothetical protein